MTIVFFASECVPFASSGGLGEVMGSLPAALAARGHSVILVLPLYRRIRDAAGLEPHDTGIRFDVPLGHEAPRAAVFRAQHHGVTLVFVANDPFFDRDELYGSSGGDYDDSFARFVFYQKAAIEAVDRLGIRATVFHAHDWQAGFIPLFRKHGIDGTGRAGDEPVVYTIHNLAYQGLAPADQFARTNLPRSCFSIEVCEFHAQVSSMKAGIVGSDLVTTVSETYAREIQTPEYGYGLDGVLRNQAQRLTGVVNGIDLESWNPRSDPHLHTGYSESTVARGKTRNRAALAQEFGLPARDRSTAMLGMVVRLVELKGFDLVAACMEELMDRDLQFVLLGTGKPEFEAACREWRARWPEKFACLLAFDPGVARRIYGASDLFLMPSRVEPCGLSQLFSMRYGTVPIATATGGLADTVIAVEDAPDEGSGFVMTGHDPAALVDAVDRALAAYARRRAWAALRKRIMGLDHGWGRSAERYETLYHSVAR